MFHYTSMKRDILIFGQFSTDLVVNNSYLRFANREGLYLPKENLMSFNDLLMTLSTEFLRLLNPGSRAIGTYVDVKTFGRSFSPIPIRGRGRLCPLHTLTCHHQSFDFPAAR